MSSVEKLWIEGIRSFSHEKPVCLRFYRPVTVILGQNGAGKTTIVECLKYASSGELPPNCKQSFVHDPKIAGKAEVKAQVKMTFTDVKGDTLTAIRSMRASQKATKVEQRSIDNVLKLEGADGRTITSKCVDMDRMMTEHLGVSKAVLTNVIFCHQEESSWPLANPADLKKKFDNIFAATRYIKALEAIKDTKKAQVLDVKQYSTELQHLTKARDHAMTIKDDVARTEGRIAATQNRVEELTEELTPVKARLDEIGSQIDEVIKQDKQIESFKATKSQKEETWVRMKRNVTTVHVVSLDELEVMHSDLRTQVTRDQNRLEKENKDLEHTERRIQELMGQKDQLLREYGKLQQENQTHKAELVERDQLIIEVAQQVDMPGYGGSDPLSCGQADKFFKEMKKYINEMKTRGKRLREENRERDVELQAKVDELKRELARLEENEKLKRKLHTENQQKLRQIASELKTAEASSSRLENLKQDLQAAERELSEEKEADRSSEYDAQVEKLKVEKKAADEDIRRLNEELQAINMKAGARGALDQLRKERRSKQEAIDRMEGAGSDGDMDELKGGSVDQVERKNQEIEMQLRQKRDDLKSTQERVRELSGQLASNCGQFQQLQIQWKERQKELKKIEDSLSEILPDGDITSALTELSKEIPEKERDFAIISSAAGFFKKFDDQLRGRHSCPLCERAIGLSDEEQLSRKLLEKVEKAPRMQQKTEQELKKLREKQRKLQAAEPSLKLKNTVAGLKEQIDKLSAEKAKQEEQIEEMHEVEDSLAAEEAALKLDYQMVKDLIRYKRELVELDAQILRQEAKLSGSRPGRTAQLVTNELQDQQMRSEQASHQIDQKRNTIADSQRRVNALQTQANGLKSEKLEVEVKMRNRCRLEEQKTEYTLANQQYECEIRETGKRRHPIQAKMEERAREKVDFLNVAREKEDDLQRQIDRLFSEGSAANKKHQSILDFLKEKKDVRLAQSEKRKQQIESQANELLRRKTSIEEQIRTLNKSLASTQLKEREINDNITMQKLKADVARIQSQIEALQRQRGGIDYAGMMRERKELEDTQERLRSERATAKGRAKQLDDELRRRKEELLSDLYREVDERRKDKLIAVKTTEIAAQDLDKYYQALDRAIMKFHSIKMREINKIIRELWMKTYKGGDIDAIKIDCDEDSINSAGSKKTYKYRVVMVKGGTELEMRGRCSTGQKVLASIIIRLALAETFCINCGVFALDEPTSNLDQENMESLAESLSELVKARHRQKNFQMIVITHDESFMEMLSRAESIECYYRVDRDPRGDSKIIRHFVKGPARSKSSVNFDDDDDDEDGL